MISEEYEQKILNGWINSKPHASVMFSEGHWKSMNFSIVGAQYGTNFASMWVA